MDQNPPRGPPHRRITPATTPVKLIRDILGCKAPTYYNAGKAWNILGYHSQQQKPIQADFVREVNELWDYLGPLSTLKARRARAILLDALRTLGFRDPGWSVNSTHLRLHEGHQDGSWDRIPSPPRGRYNYGKDDAWEYIDALAPSATKCEVDSKDKRDESSWRGYHRYHGFVARDCTSDPRPFHLRAVPVPKNADSLWHSISYFLYLRRQDPETGAAQGGPSIWHHRVLKAQIWTYLMQVLKDSSHERWQEYHLLEYKSRTTDPDFGTVSMARSLYASHDQGKPAYPHRNILYVIADYFNTEIVVFRCHSVSKNQDQESATYHHQVYGHRPATSNYPQILLATSSSGIQYDPVVFEPTSTTRRLHQGQFPTVEGHGDMWGGRAVPPWRGVRRSVLGGDKADRPPCEEARYNYLTAAERDVLDQHYPSGDIPEPGQDGAADDDDEAQQQQQGKEEEQELPVLQFAPGRSSGSGGGIFGTMAHRLGVGLDLSDVVLTDGVWARFMAGLDIPGWGFCVADEVLERWAISGEERPGVDPGDLSGPVPGWQWRFGRDPMQLGLERYAGSKRPAKAVEEGRHMLDDPYMVFETDRWRSM